MDMILTSTWTPITYTITYDLITVSDRMLSIFKKNRTKTHVIHFRRQIRLPFVVFISEGFSHLAQKGVFS